MNLEQKGRVLLVDDEKNLVAMLSKILRRHGYDTVIANDGEEAKEVLAKHFPSDPESDSPPALDAVLTDLQMPRLDGMSLLQHIKENHPELPVVVLTGHGSIQSAVDAMKSGASDYLIKPANPDEILIVLSRALEMRNLRVENRELKARVGRQETNYDIIGRSAAITETMDKVQLVARNRSTVLISGESGTGKELVARAIHDSGPFARYPFIPVNCGALSETLLESQLFGHKKGAFTGAINDHIGFFQAAEGGTLFLDEISEMSPHLQVKLLRAIQQREIIPVGDTASIRINLRIVCASNRDLEYEVRRNNFRQDLYYRLSVVNLHLPPLRERQEDIPDLVGHFILHYAKEYGVAPKTVQPEAMEVLTCYPWPGNIRELQNVIERSFALSMKDTIGAEDLPPQLFRTPEEAMAAIHPEDTPEEPKSNGAPKPLPPSRPAQQPVTPKPPTATAAAPVPAAASPRFTEPFVPQAEEPMTLEEMEKKQIIDALRRAKGRKVEAARQLGIDRKRLYRKMKKYELD